jgi:hypothetical protein
MHRRNTKRLPHLPFGTIETDFPNPHISFMQPGVKRRDRIHYGLAEVVWKDS